MITTQFLRFFSKAKFLQLLHVFGISQQYRLNYIYKIRQRNL